MHLIDFISPLIRIFLVILVLVAIEWWRPFRAAKKNWRRYSVNFALTVCTIIIFTVCFFGIALAIQRVIENEWGLLQRVKLSSWLVILISFLVLDGVTYLAHVLLHKVPLFWSLHRLHHSDVMVDVSTSFRQHPLEALLRLVFLGLAATVFGVPLAVIALYRLLSSFNALLEHANIYTPLWFDRWISWFWVTPRMHKIHHSNRPLETDSNYGNLLSLFDRLLHSFTSVTQANTVIYGLGERGLPSSPTASGLASNSGNPGTPWH